MSSHVQSGDQSKSIQVSTVKPVLNGHSKIDKPKMLMTNGSLMKVESIAECCNTFDLHCAITVLKTDFGLLFEWPLKTDFTVFYTQSEISFRYKHSFSDQLP